MWQSKNVENTDYPLKTINLIETDTYITFYSKVFMPFEFIALEHSC